MAVLRMSDYVPSAIAKSLVVKSTNTIGVITMDVRHVHYANIAYTIEQKLSTQGYNVILCNTGADKEEQAKYLKVLAEKQVDGVILVGSVLSSEETAGNIKRFFPRTPVVMHNSNIRGDNIYNISSNEGVGIELCFDYLIQKGYKSIVFIKDYDTWVAAEKLKVYKQKLEDYGIPFSNKYVVGIESGLENGRKVVRILEERKVTYSGVIGCDDITAIGVLQELHATGKRVPEDVGVIGFNNSIFSEISVPGLTAIDNNMESIGLSLSRALIDVLQGKNIPSNISIYPELVIRGSA